VWLFTIWGFFSVACMRGSGGVIDPDNLSVRARSRKHLRNLQRRFGVLPKKITILKGRDYKYRINVTKQLWATVVTDMALEQTWDNFKNAASGNAKQKDSAYISALHSVWMRMLDLQEGPRHWDMYRKQEVGDDPDDIDGTLPAWNEDVDDIR